MPRNHGLYLPPSNATQQHPIFQGDRSAWSRPQRCQLAGGGTLLETQLRTGVKDLSKSLASTQRLLANELQVNHDSIFFYCAENATNNIVSDSIISLLPPKTKSEPNEKEKRCSTVFFRAAVSYHPRNWCPPRHWRIDHPRHFWLWLLCLLRSNFTLPTTFSPALDDLFRSTRHFWLWLWLWLIRLWLICL
jgi:hypothetical protein